VSSAKFAPMTASLLARKGEAMPSPITSNPLPFSRVLERAKPQSVPQPMEPIVVIPESASDAVSMRAVVNGSGGHTGKHRKIVVTLTAREHETLGIIAVKKDVTRHQIVRSALDAYLDLLAKEYGDCNCVSRADCTKGCEPD
jgi:hypothetical protein